MNKIAALILILIIAPVLGAVYGIVHDQVSYTVSEEYYSKFKFVQFGLVAWDKAENAGTGKSPEILLESPRLGAAFVGMLASWWVGLIIGGVLALTGLLHANGTKMFRIAMQGILLNFVIAIVFGIAGLLYGLWFMKVTGHNYYLPDNLIHRHRFLAAGTMHNFSYLGGLVGLILAVLYSIRTKANKAIIPVLILVLLVACNIKQDEKNSEAYTSELLNINRVNEDLFIHISYLNTEKFGQVACNGLIYFNAEEAVIFDTPVDDIASTELISWVRDTMKKNIIGVVINHFHNDCLGGLKAFHSEEIKSYAGNLTIALAEGKGVVLPLIGFDKKLVLKVGEEDIFTEHFGPGHTRDNMVSYIPSQKTLFGGCLIKEVDAGKGNLADADTTEWSNTVRLIKQRLPDIAFVVPGHGQAGGVELLDYTIELFE